MLYLAIDQHKDQLTINLCDEQGNGILKDQISTNHDIIDDFFSSSSVGQVSIVLTWPSLKSVVLTTGYSKNSRNTNVMKSSLHNLITSQTIKPTGGTPTHLVNCFGTIEKRLQNGERPNGIRRIIPASLEDAQVRQLSNFRQFLVTQRIRIVNKIKGILNKHNMSQDAPTEIYWTKKFRKWLETVTLPFVDRLEVDAPLEMRKIYDQQIPTIELELVKRTAGKKDVAKNRGDSRYQRDGGDYSSCKDRRYHAIQDTRQSGKYFGLTPGCHNSAKSQRAGGITKSGSSLARLVLNFAVMHVVRKDPDRKAWQKRKNALEKPQQNRKQIKDVITVGPIIPRQGCTSAEPASASSDNSIDIAKQ